MEMPAYGEWVQVTSNSAATSTVLYQANVVAYYVPTLQLLLAGSRDDEWMSVQ